MVDDDRKISPFQFPFGKTRMVVVETQSWVIRQIISIELTGPADPVCACVVGSGDDGRLLKHPLFLCFRETCIDLHQSV